jgi:alanyl-tRNA synthetase
MTAKELREKYIRFFKEHNHAEISGKSLIPENDPTVLFTTAGMHPLVPYIIGEEHPAGTRLTNVQKCIRTGDIEEVGDSSHLTFFEMLGNWSLGDYFKEEAISMSWSSSLARIIWALILRSWPSPYSKVMRTPPGMRKAPGLWKKLGIPEDRIFYLPKSDTVGTRRRNRPLRP